MVENRYKYRKRSGWRWKGLRECVDAKEDGPEEL